MFISFLCWSILLYKYTICISILKNCFPQRSFALSKSNQGYYFKRTSCGPNNSVLQAKAMKHNLTYYLCAVKPGIRQNPAGYLQITNCKSLTKISTAFRFPLVLLPERIWGPPPRAKELAPLNLCAATSGWRVSDTHVLETAFDFAIQNKSFSCTCMF